MTVNKKIKIINKKIEQNKGKYNLDRQASKIFFLSSLNDGKYKLLSRKYILSEKELLEIDATIKRL